MSFGLNNNRGRTFAVRPFATMAGWTAVLISTAAADVTRAPPPAERSQMKVETITRGLENPWAVQELPDGRMIVTERPGRMRIVTPDGEISPPLGNLPKIAVDGQGGLMDVALATDFESSKTLFFTYSEPRKSGQSGTALARARLDLNASRPALSDVHVIFRQKPDVASSLHFGSRIVISRDGNLFVTLGDRYSGRDQAQNPKSHFGKIIYITPDGRPVANTPNRPGWAAEVWSIGHRNPQGAAIHPETGKLWTVEHGARGGDEVNMPETGRNYGWPIITYGRDYSGQSIGEGTTKAGMEQPIYYWDPSIAPSGMTFYNSDRNPNWKGNLFVGALAGSHLSRLTLSGEKVTGEERLLDSLDERIRDVRQARDGTLLVVTDEQNGRIVRITPNP